MFAKAGIGFAAAALAISVFYFSSSSPAAKPDVADIKNSGPSAPQVQAKTSDEPAPRYVASSKDDVAAPKPKSTANRSEHPRAIVVSHVTAQPVVRKNELATNNTNKTIVPTAKKAPRLTTVEDEDDKSLRLADLFAEIGSSEE